MLPLTLGVFEFERCAFLVIIFDKFLKIVRAGSMSAEDGKVSQNKTLFREIYQDDSFSYLLYKS